MSDARWRVPWPDRFGAWWQRTLPRLGPWLAQCESRFAAHECDLGRVERPVFICGLPRSGSTMLLEWLAAMPGFAAHRYADFPLFWTPWWWNRLRARLPANTAAPVERAHGDGILVTRDSPEAFEELLWEHAFPPSARACDVLDAETAATGFARAHRAHVAKLVCARAAQRYVAKGHANSLRTGLLQRLYPDAHFLLPIREPLAHIASMLRQDALYAGAPPATLAHIAARGHHEFGPRKRALRVTPEQGARIEALWREGRHADGWLQQWIDVYGHLLQHGPRAGSWVVHEDLCAQPDAVLAGVADRLGLGMDSRVLLADWAVRFRTRPHPAPRFEPPPDPARVALADALMLGVRNAARAQLSAGASALQT